MKRCNVCGTETDDCAATCALDGECSFTPPFDIPVIESETVADVNEPLFQPVSAQPRKWKNR